MRDGARTKGLPSGLAYGLTTCGPGGSWCSCTWVAAGSGATSLAGRCVAASPAPPGPIVTGLRLVCLGLWGHADGRLELRRRSEVSGEVADAASSAGEPSQVELLASIQGSRVALEGKIEAVAVEVNLLRADLRKVSDKVKAAEGTISELQSEVGTLRTQMAQATSTVGRLEARLEDAEGSSQRNNIRLLGFPEHAEGSAIESFVENRIKDVMQPAGLSRVFVVERVHQALIVPPRPGAPSRAITARLLNYKDQDCVLRAAPESDKALYENFKISIYPDYTNKVQNSRKGFMEVKAKLRAMNIRYMLL
ncbi:hypothetical protein NDU88_002500 [Pleurodeles waltl]|uniref:L1 transposable element RRM domain-containing protein n=1 Tax=Pleurodeles waltl TaxID=8319 RepID=A0AAV7LEC4_PLEWA|nr:hypothetical protein NDU88_002500 [Pleurodeles waltl]